MACLAGLGVGGALGGLISPLVGMGVPENEAKRYEERITSGGVLLSVHRVRCNAGSIAKLTGLTISPETGFPSSHRKADWAA
jgi:hypothetical protein